MSTSATDDKVVLPVAPGEDPWTAEEIEEIREDLEFDMNRVKRTLRAAEADLESMFAGGAAGAGRDPADVGSSNFERDQEMSLIQNARELLEQCQLAFKRLETGQYGLCEVCDEPIGKARLQVFPRATLCLTCKQREERR